MRRTSRSIGVVLFIAGTAALVAARPVAILNNTALILPGSRELSTSHLMASTLRFRYFNRPGPDSAEKETGGGTSSVIPVEHNGKPALLLVTHSGRPERMFIDTALVMRDGLAPIWEVSRFGGRILRWEYSGKHVKRTMTHPDSGTRTTEHTYDVPVFHFNELDALIRSLPLREGFEAILPLYSEGSDELEMDSVRVMSHANGIWSIRFADPAIVASYGVDATTRRVVRYEATLRKTGAVGRRVIVE